MGTSLVVQSLGICPAVWGTQVWSLVGELGSRAATSGPRAVLTGRTAWQQGRQQGRRVQGPAKRAPSTRARAGRLWVKQAKGRGVRDQEGQGRWGQHQAALAPEDPLYFSCGGLCFLPQGGGGQTRNAGKRAGGSGFFRLKGLLIYLLHRSHPIISLEIYARYVAIFSVALM